MTTAYESQVVKAIRGFKAELRAHEGAQVNAMATKYLDVEKALEANITALTEQLARLAKEGIEPNWSQLYRLERWQALQLQLMEELARFNGWAADVIKAEQLDLITRGIDNAAAALEVSKPGLGQFTRMPHDALQGMVGIARDGSPLGDLLASSYPAIRDVMTRELVRSVALGRNPRVTAALVRKATGIGLNRALIIARTEQLRVYREATRESYVSAGVTQYQRIAALDERTCFPAGTLIETQAGPVPIEMVTPGTVVLSGKRAWRAVTATMARPYDCSDGQVTEVRTVLGAGFVSTHDHPVLVERQGQLDWIAAGCLKVGDAVVGCAQSGANLGDHSLGDGSIERRVCDAHDQVPATDEAQRLAPVGVGALVPVHAVDFEGDVQVRQMEVDRVAVKTGLLDERDSKHAETAAHVPLGFRLASVPAIARRAAELLKRHGRDDAKVLAALETRVDDGRTATEFGAVFTGVPIGSEDLSAAGARRVERVPGPALTTAVVIAVGDAGAHRERLAARLADLRDHFGLGRRLIAGAGAVHVAFGRTVDELRAALQTSPLLPVPLPYAHACAAAVEIPGGGFDFGSPAPVRDSAHRADKFDATRQIRLHTDIVSHVENRCEGWQPVYNLEVAEDHTYFAGGILVHNCVGCAVADGEILSTEAEFDEHCQGRCDLLPIIVGVENPQAQSYQDWYGRQDEATQRGILGPGRYDALKSGSASWQDLGTHTHSDQWGGAYVPTLVSNLPAVTAVAA